MLDPVALTKALIRCPSVTPEPAGVLTVVAEALGPLGFAIERLRFEGGGSYPVDNLFATRGHGNRHVLFIGHTDVVPPGEGSAWTHPPFTAEETGGLLFGRGAADMKSGIGAFIAALSGLDSAGLTVSLAITNDEEADAINGTARLVDWALARGHRFDLAIVGEPSAAARVGDSIKIGRRGSFSGRIVVTGTQGHAAYPEKANNPMPVLAALAMALKAVPLDAGSDRFPPSNLEITSIDTGNRATNVIPASGSLAFNIRYNDRWDPDSLAAWVRERIAGVEARGTAIDFAVLGRPARAFLSPDSGEVACAIAAITEATGAPPQLSTAGGTSDARFIAPHCPVIELGLPGPTMHQVDEHVRVADIHELAHLYRAVLEALGSPG